MNKQEKASEIEALQAVLKGGPTAFVLAPKGLTVNQVTALRRRVRATQGQMKVVKNRLALRAMKGTALEPLSSHFKGETAIAWTSADPAPLAKAIDEFAKDHQGLGIKAGLVDGRAVVAAQVKAIADLPARPVLVARLLAVLNAPMTRFVTVLKGPHRGVVRAMSEIAKQKAGAGETAAPTE
ncbi:MAG TPA: 50S ribosomal protein L10 [Candidatus Polarisedimenticolia bacterium]|jgi:large subunit ribosomal protein L10|nr:50S ribosomal protein L10 [Candidatus Polarisedimenticolia bacterium]